MNAFCNELTASFFLPKRVNNFDPVGMLAGRRILWKLVEQVLQGGLEAGVSIDFSSGKRWVSTQRYYPPLPLGNGFGIHLILLTVRSQIQAHHLDTTIHVHGLFLLFDGLVILPGIKTGSS